jgi:phage shock protein PspC (stress-responsive transcriptional regulator)
VNEEIKSLPNPVSGARRLYRSVANRRIAGVCGGMAEYFNIDPLIVRLVWVLSIFVHGIGLFAYVAAWIIIPESHQPVTTSPPPTRSTGGHYIWGAALIVLGVIFLADRLDWDFLVPWRWHYFLPYWFNWGVAFSVFIILIGLMLIFRVNSGPTKSPDALASPFVPPSTTFTETSGAGAYSQGGISMNEKRLIRSLDDRMIGGVCGGLAKYLNVDPSFVRIGFVLMTILSGMIIGIVTYIVMMIVVPEENPSAKNPVSSVSTPVGNA